MTYGESRQWHRWFAWYPTSAGWFRFVERRDVCSEAAAWVCAPIWEYRVSI